MLTIIKTVIWPFLSSLLKRYWPYVVALVVLAYFIIRVDMLQATVDRQTETIKTMQISMGTLADNNHKLVISTEAINESLSVLSSQSQSTKMEFERLKGSVSTNLSQVSKKLDRVVSTPVPQTSDDAIKYLIDARKEYPAPPAQKVN